MKILLMFEELLWTDEQLKTMSPSDLVRLTTILTLNKNAVTAIPKVRAVNNGLYEVQTDLHVCFVKQILNYKAILVELVP